mmetsp:Transcript_48821/g.145890  ORF Transcript_48821/g.145890 Transcript_48821/m.145890 type:complete len:486 (+) Transcript_48821:88-1545(+)
MVKRPWEPSVDGLSPDESGLNGADAPDFASAVLQLAPPAKFEEAAGQAMEAVDIAVKAEFGEQAYVLPYGSLVQGMHLDGSDLDLAIEAPGEDLIGQAPPGGKVDNTTQVAALKRLMRKLPGAFRVIETRFWKHMKVPIIILGYRSGSGEEVETDISVGAVFEDVPKGLTDRLVRRVLARVPRAMHLARLMKLWARLEKLNKAYDGYLNSLGWTLMVLFFFMERGEVLPSALQEEEPNENGPDGNGGALPPCLHRSEDFGSRDEELIEVPSYEEVAEFFEWLVSYANSWPEDPPEAAWGISLVDGTMIEVPKPSKVWADSTSLFIEDPGVRMSKGTSENVARSLKVAPWRITLKRCEAAAATLRAGHPDAADAWIGRLLQEAAAERDAKTKAAVPAAKFSAALRTPAAAKPDGPRPPVWALKAGPQAAAKAKAAAPWPQAAFAAAGNGHQWPGQLPTARRPKTEICKWFLKGECWSGARCKNSHG